MKGTIRLCRDLRDLSRVGARLFRATVKDAAAARGQALVALSGGGTPAGLYKELAKSESADAVDFDWSAVHLFWGDERCVKPGDAASNFEMARAALIEHVAIPAANVHPIACQENPAPAAQAYAQLLGSFAEAPLAWPRFDLVLLGLGGDGHVAAIFPGAASADDRPVVAVKRQYDARPVLRVTLTEAVFNSARRVVFLVSGQRKAGIVQEALEGAQDPLRLPAHRIRPSQGEIIWLLDSAAASQLSGHASTDVSSRPLHR